MTTAELAHACAREILELVDPTRPAPITDPAKRQAIVEMYVRGVINRALDEQTRSVQEVVNIESGHVSLDVGTTAKGDYQYSAKVVMPFVGADEAAGAREHAQAELERAAAFLRERFGRAS